MTDILNTTVETRLQFTENGKMYITNTTKEEQLIAWCKKNFKYYYSRMHHYYHMTTRPHYKKLKLARNRYYVGRYVPRYWEE